MRIAFVALGYAPLRMSGLDISGERLVKGLLETGHEVTVVAARRQPLAEIVQHPRLNIQRLPIGKSNWIGYCLHVAQFLQNVTARQNFDVIHFWDVQFAYAYSGIYVASLHQSFAQRIACLPPSWNAPAQWLYYQTARFFTERRSVARAKGLLAVSATTQQAFAREYHLDPARLALTRHGIDQSVFRRVPDTASLRAQLGIAPEERVILFSGFITLRKGLSYLARVLPQITPPVRLVITGRWTESARRRFRQELGPAANRVVEAGFVPDNQLPSYYSLADLYVSASVLEGFGLPLAEALACATPVVAFDVGATAEVVGPGGIVVPPRNTLRMAQAINQLLGDAERRSSLAQLGRAHVTRHFDMAQMIRDTLAAYARFA